MVKIILSLIYTGFRPTELLQLTRFNYDVENKLLIGGIKTDAGKNRAVPIHPAIQGYVDYFCSLKGETLFCREDYKGYTLNNFRGKHYYQTLEHLNLPRISPHGCRHTLASLLKMHGADDTTTTKILGHTKYEFTEKVYTHLEAEYLHKEMSKINI